MALTAEQLAKRKIGGSSVATILGINDEHKSAVEEFHELIGHIEREDLSDSPHIAGGNILEDGIAELAAWHMSRAWGRQVRLRRCNLTLTHPKYDWLTVHIDRDVVGEQRGVECKNVGARSAYLWGPSGSDEVPDWHLPQVHTYMLIKNYPVWTEAAYFGGPDMRLYEIERDREWDELIVTSTHDFWHHHVLPARQALAAGVPMQEVLAKYEPAFDLERIAPARSLEVMRRIYPGTNGKTVPAPAEALAWREVHLQASALKNEYETTLNNAKAHLLRLMGENAVMEFPDGFKFTRKLIKRKAYAVDECSYIDFRAKKPGKAANDDAQEAA